MILNELHLENFRCYEALDLYFNEKLTVLVGKNGSGKTSILDAISIALGSLFLKIDGITTKSIHEGDAYYKVFNTDDLYDSIESQYPVSITSAGVIDGKPIRWTREVSYKGGNTRYGKAGSIATISKSFQDRVRKGDETLILPLVAYYGTGRLWDNHKEKKYSIDFTSRTEGYIDCLDGSANIKLMEQWLKKNAYDKYQRREAKLPLRPFLDVVLNAISKSIEGISGMHDVHVMTELNNQDYITVVYTDENGFRRKMPISSMSAGCKNTMSLIADIAYRLSVLNPQLGERILESPGIVLIDEIDLHLHPQWQYRILNDLTTIFPNIQFIVSTHAPSVINSVKKENIAILDSREVFSLSHEVYGREAGAIMNEIMDVPDRPEKIAEGIEKVNKLLDDAKYSEAKMLLDEIDALTGYADADIQVLLASES